MSPMYDEGAPAAGLSGHPITKKEQTPLGRGCTTGHDSDTDATRFSPFLAVLLRRACAGFWRVFLVLYIILLL